MWYILKNYLLISSLPINGKCFKQLRYKQMFKFFIQNQISLVKSIAFQNGRLVYQLAYIHHL